MLGEGIFLSARSLKHQEHLVPEPDLDIEDHNKDRTDDLLHLFAARGIQIRSSPPPQSHSSSDGSRKRPYPPADVLSATEAPFPSSQSSIRGFTDTENARSRGDEEHDGIEQQPSKRQKTVSLTATAVELDDVGYTTLLRHNTYHGVTRPLDSLFRVVTSLTIFPTLSTLLHWMR